MPVLQVGIPSSVPPLVDFAVNTLESHPFYGSHLVFMAIAFHFLTAAILLVFSGSPGFLLLFYYFICISDHCLAHLEIMLEFSCEAWLYSSNFQISQFLLNKNLIFMVLKFYFAFKTRSGFAAQDGLEFSVYFQLASNSSNPPSSALNTQLTGMSKTLLVFLSPFNFNIWYTALLS